MKFLMNEMNLIIRIGFTLLYLINYPQVQHKMQEELDQVCGTALPSLALRARYSIKVLLIAFNWHMHLMTSF